MKNRKEITLCKSKHNFIKYLLFEENYSEAQNLNCKLNAIRKSKLKLNPKSKI